MAHGIVKTLILVLGLGGAAAAESEIATFTLTDHLERNWTRELVFFAVSPSVFGREDLRLLDGEDKPQPYQWVPGRAVGKRLPRAAGHGRADALVEYEFPGFCYWRLKARVIAGEPVVLIDEEFVLPAGSSYVLDLAKGFSPDELFYRDNANNCQLVKIASSRRRDRVPAASLAHLVGRNPRKQLDGFLPKSRRRSADDRVPRTGRVGRTGPDRMGHDGLRSASPTWRRNFSSAVSAASGCWPPCRKPNRSRKKRNEWHPLPQQYLIKHGDVPLDTVKDYTLTWNDSASRHPGLFLSQNELQRFKSRFKVDEERLAKLRETKVYSYQMDEHVAYYLVTGDAGLGARLKEVAFEHVQSAVDGLVKQERSAQSGELPAPPCPVVMWGAIWATWPSRRGYVRRRKDRLKAQLAFLGYTLSSPTFHSPERGYQANPNMTTMARGMAGADCRRIPTAPRGP